MNLAYCLNAKGGCGRIDGESETFLPVGFTNRGIATDGLAETARAQSHGAMPMVAHTLRADGFDASEDGTGRGTPLVAAAITADARHANIDQDRGTLVFDERNITSKGNRTRVEAGRECHTLHESPPTIAYQCQGTNVGEMGTLKGDNITRGVPFVMQERMESLNPNCGPNGKGWSDAGVAFTLESRNKPQSVASTFGVRRLTPRECSRLQGFPDNWLESDYADATQTHARQVLCEVWKSACTEAREGWRPGISASLLTPEILLAGVHGGWISWEVASRCAAGRRSLSGADSWTEGFVRVLQETASRGPSPYRRESFEQLARQLGRPVQVVPYEEAQAIDDLLHSWLWQEASQKWPLRPALSEGEAWDPFEFADSPRYRMMGNAVSVPVVQWIGRRILEATHA